MTKRFFVTGISAVLLLSLCACRSLEKRPFHEGINLPDRIHNQQTRIDMVVSSGDLTRAEAEIVRDNLESIRQEYEAARSDGKISGEEWNKIEGRLDENSRMINDVKNNPARRLFPPPSQPPAVMSIQERINIQQQRIDQDISTGGLTLREADIVQGNLNWIKARYGYFKSDGNLTPHEENEILEYLEKNGNMILQRRDHPVSRIY